LIIMPSGILPFVLRVWVSRFPRSVSQGVN
jgi:hypothetical protein